MRRTILLTLIAAALLLLAVFGSQALTSAPTGEMGTGGQPIAVAPDIPVQARAVGGSPVEFSVALSQSHLLRGGDGRVNLVVTASAPQVQRKARFPLHIALVLDRSGSMAGEKLAQARQAAREMIQRLSPEDQLALIIYDSSVDVLMPLTSLAEGRSQLLAALERFSDRGGTNLGGGLEAGIRELKRMPSASALHRVILISDGQANEGVTDPTTLNGWVEAARQQSISVSTMGVGLDYNEDLMMALADHGGGTYHYIKDAQSLTGIFSKELDNLFTTVAREMVLQVRPAPGVMVEQVYGYPSERGHGQLNVPLGDLPAGDRRSAVLDLSLPSARLGPLAVVEVLLRYRDAQNDGRPVEQALQLQAAITDDSLKAQRSEDRLALEQAETARAADTTRTAMILYEKGQVVEARALARQKAALLDKLGQRIQSKAVQQQSQILLELDNEINAAPAPSSSAGKGLLKKSKAQAWEQFRK